MARNTDPSAKTVRLVRERDGWSCVRCGSPDPLNTQHRAARGMGGTRVAWINKPANLITLCGSGTTGCHGWVERHPAAARYEGLSILRGDDPRHKPVLTRWGWLLLDNDGGYEPMEEPPF